MQEDFNREKQEFDLTQNEKSESYQQFSKEIQSSKGKIRELETKSNVLKREVKKK